MPQDREIFTINSADYFCDGEPPYVSFDVTLDADDFDELAGEDVSVHDNGIHSRMKEILNRHAKYILKGAP